MSDLRAVALRQHRSYDEQRLGRFADTPVATPPPRLESVSPLTDTGTTEVAR